MNSHPRSAVSKLVTLIAAGGLVALLCAAERAPVPEPIAREIEGVWAHVGEPGNVRAAPQPGDPLKFRMNNRWTYTQADAETGVVKAHFGGIYRVNGNEYLETIVYSTNPDDDELGHTLKFIVTIQGDTMTQTGVGNPYTEVWKRVR